jgi:hypothetical protein
VPVLSNDAAVQPAVNRIAVRALELMLESQTGITQPRKVKPAGSPQPWSHEAMRTIEGACTTVPGHRRASAAKRATLSVGGGAQAIQHVMIPKNQLFRG